MSNNLPKFVPSKRFLFELLFNGATMKTLCNASGWSVFYIRKKLKEYDLPTPREYKQTTLREMWEYRIAVEYMRLNGVNTIAARTPFQWYDLTDILHELGILTDLHLGGHVMKMRLDSGWQPLSPHLQQVLEGELLGDGHLQVNDSVETSHPLPSDDAIINALDDLQWFSWVDIEPVPNKLDEAISLFNNTRETLAYLHGADFKLQMALHAADWIDYIATQFRAGGYYVNIFPTKWVDEDGVEHPAIFLSTESSLNLRREQLRWYDPLRGVPWDFTLTCTSLLHWFVGDGSFTSNEIIFSTDNFHLTDVMRLALELRRTVGVKANLFWRPPTTKFGTTEPLSPEEFAQLDPNRYWRIKVPANFASRTRFLDYLNQAPGIDIARQVFPWKFSRSIKKEDCV
ncbi:MAG: hypothetical protein ACFFC7_24940 [Candidatus Hermodarchaeota archaeon]